MQIVQGGEAMKVYCKDCTKSYYCENVYFIPDGYYCSIKPIVPRVVFRDMQEWEANPNNDCPDFSPKLWYRIKMLLKWVG
jgi:hypothetical protein